MFSFINYAREIYQVSKSNNVDTGIAYDMFRKDVENGYNANCGSVLDGFDFVGPKLTRAEQDEARGEWRDFSGRAFKDLSEALAEGDREAFDELIAQYPRK